jgi:hypothetical protein
LWPLLMSLQKSKTKKPKLILKASLSKSRNLTTMKNLSKSSRISPKKPETLVHSQTSICNSSHWPTHCTQKKVSHKSFANNRYPSCKKSLKSNKQFKNKMSHIQAKKAHKPKSLWATNKAGSLFLPIKRNKNSQTIAIWMTKKGGLHPLTTHKKWLKSTLPTLKLKNNNRLSNHFKSAKSFKNKTKLNYPSLWSVLTTPSKTSPLTWVSSWLHLTAESFLRSEGSFGSVTFAGNKLTSLKTKLSFAQAADTTVYQRYLTAWTRKATSFCTEKKDGSPTQRCKNGKTKSSRSNKRERNINTKDVPKVTL